MPKSSHSVDSIPRSVASSLPPHPASHCQSASTPSFPYSHHEDPSLKIIIVGAGIGGLLMGFCLEKAGIDYVILERMQRSQISKATIQLSSNTLYSLEQLGLLDEVMRIAKPIGGMTLRKQNLSAMGRVDVSYFNER